MRARIKIDSFLRFSDRASYIYSIKVIYTHHEGSPRSEMTAFARRALRGNYCGDMASDHTLILHIFLRSERQVTRRDDHQEDVQVGNFGVCFRYNAFYSG